MKILDSRRPIRGFTLLELVIVLLMIALLFAMLLPMLSISKVKSGRIRCVNNLKNVGLGFRIWSTTNTNRSPIQVFFQTNNASRATDLANGQNLYRYFQSLSNELSTPKILVCSSDTRTAAKSFDTLRNENISYFLGWDADERTPTSLLAGDRNLTLNEVPVSSGILNVTSNTILGWSKTQHNGNGNLALGDGSVQQLTPARLRQQILTFGATTNRLIIP
jgi:prepilin-type N-terminal cleavage/methylation domain-containing protein/prepilin-type processing-associated H-X9-DG protein